MATCLIGQKSHPWLFLTSSFEKRGFRMTPIFNGLQPLKMAVHPCTALSLPDITVFLLDGYRQWLQSGADSGIIH